MTSLTEYQTIAAYPTVSTDQWKKYAIKKMSAGYLLIISSTRNMAKFYKGEGVIEPCSYRTAKRLLRQGCIEPVGTHLTGTIYQLSESYKEEMALSMISKSQMGTVHVFEDDDEVENDDAGFDIEEALTDEVLAADDEEADLDVVAT